VGQFHRLVSLLMSAAAAVLALVGTWQWSGSPGTGYLLIGLVPTQRRCFGTCDHGEAELTREAGSIAHVADAASVGGLWWGAVSADASLSHSPSMRVEEEIERFALVRR
jgi:hypothetical protein